MTDVAGNASLFGPAWQGWESYRQFAQSVKVDSRYVRPKAASDFLEEIAASCGSRVVTLPKGHIFWRARLGCEYEEVTDDDALGEVRVSHIEERPHGRAGMKPVAHWQSEGRANPRGIPYLYLATTRETALAEVRPWIGAPISVAQFQIMRVHCSETANVQEKTEFGWLLIKHSLRPSAKARKPSTYQLR